MFILRKSDERGIAEHGWLHSRFTFSFADYFDPKNMGFRHLRVINDDWIDPDSGFGTHPHRDMEIFTYVLEGELTHQDNTGQRSVMSPGRVQLMRAGTGIQHSEMNASTTTKAHLYQIWILPREDGLQPGYWEADFNKEDVQNRLHLLVSPEAGEARLHIQQDARIYAALFDAGTEVKLPITHSQGAWLQLASGRVVVNGDIALKAGDGLAIEEESAPTILAEEAAEFLLFVMD